METPKFDFFPKKFEIEFDLYFDLCWRAEIIQVGRNMHLYVDIGDASSSLWGSTSSYYSIINFGDFFYQRHFLNIFSVGILAISIIAMFLLKLIQFQGPGYDSLTIISLVMISCKLKILSWRVTEPPCKDGAFQIESQFGRTNVKMTVLLCWRHLQRAARLIFSWFDFIVTGVFEYASLS